MHRLVGLLAVSALAVMACAPTSPTAVPASPTAAGVPSVSPSPSSAAVPRPILITTDLAADDLMAIMAMLREPSVDVRAIAVDGNGEVHCAAGLRNMRRLLGAFDRTDIPLGCGRELPGANGRLFPDAWRSGADGFYGVDLPAVAATSAGADAARLIAETAAASPQPLTIVALGPWTSIADAFSADATLPGRLAGIHAMAGTIDAPGNISVGDVTPANGVEWNVGVDPDSFAAVLATDVKVTLVPLDATNDVPVPSDFASVLESDHRAAGADIAYEMFVRSPFLTVDTSFWDTLAVMSLVDPSLVSWEDLTASVKLGGPSSGHITRDPGGRPLRAAMAADAAAFQASFLAALRRGDPRPEPFSFSGALALSWDGTTCRIEGTPPASAGVTRIELENRSSAPVGALVAGVKAPKAWADVIALLHSVDPSDPNLQIPDWVIQIPMSLAAEAGQTASVVVTLPAAEVGALCGTGEWPNLEFHDAGSFVVAN